MKRFYMAAMLAAIFVLAGCVGSYTTPNKTTGTTGTKPGGSGFKPALPPAFTFMEMETETEETEMGLLIEAVDTSASYLKKLVTPAQIVAEGGGGGVTAPLALSGDLPGGATIAGENTGTTGAGVAGMGSDGAIGVFGSSVNSTGVAGSSAAGHSGEFFSASDGNTESTVQINEVYGGQAAGTKGLDIKDADNNHTAFITLQGRLVASQTLVADNASYVSVGTSAGTETLTSFVVPSGANGGLANNGDSVEFMAAGQSNGDVASIKQIGFTLTTVGGIYSGSAVGDTTNNRVYRCKISRINDTQIRVFMEEWVDGVSSGIFFGGTTLTGGVTCTTGFTINMTLTLSGSNIAAGDFTAFHLEARVNRVPFAPVAP